MDWYVSISNGMYCMDWHVLVSIGVYFDTTIVNSLHTRRNMYFVQMHIIHSNTYHIKQYTPILNMQIHTYHYIQIQTNTIPNELFHLVSIGLYCVCSIQTNTCHYIPNTCQYILILNTNGDETRRNNRYGLACIWYV